jgi:hypothetical protein
LFRLDRVYTHLKASRKGAASSFRVLEGRIDHRPGRQRRLGADEPAADSRSGAGARWKKLLEDGSFRSAGEITEAEKVDRSFVNRLLRLTLLAPDVVEAILEGGQPKAMQLEELPEAIPSEWEKQRKALLSSAV